jgi:hypothetical protein
MPYVKYQNGDLYVGSLLDGKKHGFGIYTWLNKTIYIGEWKNGSRHGKGLMKVNGRIVFGVWYSGKYQGQDDASARNIIDSSVLANEGDFKLCKLCNSESDKFYVALCGHSGFCENCMLKLHESSNIDSKIICPFCRKAEHTIRLFY